MAGFQLHGLAPGQHTSEETSRAVGDTMFKLTGHGIEPHTSRTDSDVYYHHAIWLEITALILVFIKFVAIS